MFLSLLLPTDLKVLSYDLEVPNISIRIGNSILESQLYQNFLTCCRDPTELQKPSSVNTAVVRYYRYVQAARDGQDLKDCLRIYAACAINTEK